MHGLCCTASAIVLLLMVLSIFIPFSTSISISSPFLRKPSPIQFSRSWPSFVNRSASSAMVAQASVQSPTKVSPPLSKTKNMKVNQVLNFIAGGLAGMISSSITIPLEVIKTQLQTSTRRADMTPIDICKKIYERSGPQGFFKGLQPLLLGIIPTRAIYFWSYSATKNALSQTLLKNSSWAHFISAVVAGVASNTVSRSVEVAIEISCSILTFSFILCCSFRIQYGWCELATRSLQISHWVRRRTARTGMQSSTFIKKKELRVSTKG